MIERPGTYPPLCYISVCNQKSRAATVSGHVAMKVIDSVCNSQVRDEDASLSPSLDTLLQ